jgi:hypothetical protein
MVTIRAEQRNLPASTVLPSRPARRPSCQAIVSWAPIKGVCLSRSRSAGMKLLDWYTKRARPFLEQHAQRDVTAIDQQALRVEHLTKTSDEEVAVCFLGNAGVGKSTLLNALVSERYDILPHGGVGPLTAQATVVRYAAAPYFKASYFPPKALNRILFILERTSSPSGAHPRQARMTNSPPRSTRTSAAKPRLLFPSSSPTPRPKV